MLRCKMKQKQGGFTIIELMFTIALAAILLAIGVPNFRDFLRNGRMAGQANDLLTGLNLARSEAVKRRAPVTLCAGTTAGGCSLAGDFKDGWIVLVDFDSDGAVDAGDVVVKDHGPMPDGYSTAVYQTADTEDDESPTYDASTTRYVSFGQNGFRRMNDGSLPVALALVFCDSRGNVASGGGPDMSTARALELTTAGRASITRSVERIETLGGCP